MTSTPRVAGIDRAQIHISRIEDKDNGNVENVSPHSSESSNISHDASASLFSAVNTLNRTISQFSDKLDEVLQTSVNKDNTSGKENTVIVQTDKDCEIAQLKQQLVSLERNKKSQETRHKNNLKEQLNSYEDKIRNLLAENERLKRNIKEKPVVMVSEISTGSKTASQDKFPSFYHMDAALDLSHIDTPQDIPSQQQAGKTSPQKSSSPKEALSVPPKVPVDDNVSTKVSPKSKGGPDKSEIPPARPIYVDDPDRPPIYFKGQMPKAKKRYGVLSNLYKYDFVYNGQPYKSNEHAIHHTKMTFLNQKTRANRILRESDPSKIQEISDEVPNTPEWDEKESEVREQLTRIKREECPRFYDVLMSTHGHELREDTLHKRWGYRNGKGLNEMGLILMRMRDDFDLEERIEALKNPIPRPSLNVPQAGSHSPGIPPFKCLRCGTLISPGSKFCAECGLTVDNRRCDTCNEFSSSTAKYCRNCGKTFMTTDNRQDQVSAKVETKTEHMKETGSSSPPNGATESNAAGESETLSTPPTELNANAATFIPDEQPSTPPKRKKVVVFGDSQSHGVHPHMSGNIVATIPLSGHKIFDIKDMVPSVIDESVTDAVLVAGTNDVLQSTEEEFSEDYLNLVSEVVKCSKDIRITCVGMFYRYDQGYKNTEVNDKIAYFNNNIISNMGHHYIDTMKNGKGQLIYTKKLVHLDLHGRYLLSKACENALRSDGKVTHIFPTPPRPQREWYPEEEIHQDNSVPKHVKGYRYPPKGQWNQGPPPRLRQHGTYSENFNNGANNNNSANNMSHGTPGPAMSNGAMPTVPGTTNGYTVPSSVYGAMPAQMPCNQMFNVPYTGNMYGATGVSGGLDPQLMGHASMY